MQDNTVINEKALSELSLPAIQRRLESLYRAWTQVALGMITAGVAELDVARSLCASGQRDWALTMHQASPQEMARHWLIGVKARSDLAMRAQRHATDLWTAALIGAAETLIGEQPNDVGTSHNGGGTQEAATRRSNGPARDRQAA